MKKLFTLLSFVITLITTAQAPQGFNYQATVRDNLGALIINQNVNFKFNIMLNSQTSVPVYSETHYVPTDDLGQVNLVVGAGTATTGTFSAINWASGTYYLGIELNTGTGYLAMGTTQLLSVPYALYANSSGTTQTPNLAAVLAVNNGANNSQIKNLSDPTDLQDAATKKYIDDIKTQLQSQISNLQNFIMNNPAITKQEVLSLYDIFALSGPDGPGSSHIIGIDPGESPFIRCLVNLEDFTADGVKNRWGDDGLDQLTTTEGWDSNNKFFNYQYARMYYAIKQCNLFLNVLNGSNPTNKITFQSETRFLRALAYYYIIDSFGKGPLVTEVTTVDPSTLPESTRIQLFNYVESELLALENNNIPYSYEYGRANLNAVRMLLAKLYLNSEVYTGTPKYTEALTYSNKIITQGNYSLTINYKENFSADNNNSSEIIFPLIADATERQSYANTTYIVNGSLDAATMPITQFGATSGWSGHRATKAWYGLFASSAAGLSASSDVRASLFWTSGHTYEMTDYKVWANGYPSTKFRNLNTDGLGSATNFSSTDFPLFRYADVYLMYAECVLRGAAGGNITNALAYVNAVRARANAATIAQSSLTLNFILDERARELNLEGHRRTDLIRFGKFTGGNYLWPWKGNVLNGTSIPVTYKLFPIPTSALQANPNLTQNPGY